MDSKKYIGTDEVFLFSLFPQEKKYSCKLKQGNHLMCTREFFSIGDSGYAL